MLEKRRVIRPSGMAFSLITALRNHWEQERDNRLVMHVFSSYTHWVVNTIEHEDDDQAPESGISRTNFLKNHRSQNRLISLSTNDSNIIKLLLASMATNEQSLEFKRANSQNCLYYYRCNKTAKLLPDDLHLSSVSVVTCEL